MRSELNTAVNEKDVENFYREALRKELPKASITSPYNCDGLLQVEDILCLLEFKRDLDLKTKLYQCVILIQVLFYLKKFEVNGERIPSTVFVGDINECFAVHTGVLLKYLKEDVDWSTAPSDAHKKFPELLHKMIDDLEICPFVFDVDDSFTLRPVIHKLYELSNSTQFRVKITETNIASTFDYFDKHVLAKNDLTINERANLFVQIIINPSENFVHPKKKGVLNTKSFGEVKIKGEAFTAFFSHFDGEEYSPRDKERLTALVDRLIDDETRRRKGEFFTPTVWVNEAHKMITEEFGENWKDEYVVWDPACGTCNLTRDYKFKELYCSTLEKSDLDTADQMGYNPEAVKFQYDFLNDPYEKLPEGLRNAIENGKEIIVFMNPPYGTSSNMGTHKGDHKAGVSATKIGDEMRKSGWGKSTQQLYAQFLYRVWEINKKANITVAIYAKSLYKTGGSYKEFRSRFYSKFEFMSSMLFNAKHFSDTSDAWAVDFSIWKSGKEDRDTLKTLVKDTGYTGVQILQEKYLYTTGVGIPVLTWLGKENSCKTATLPKMSSALEIREVNIGFEAPTLSLGTLVQDKPSVYANGTGIILLSGGFSAKWAKSFVSKENVDKVVSLFAARKAVQPNWINDKDEYLAPNVQHLEYPQFVLDSYVYSLFNNSSQQSSLRNVLYKGKTWDIKNHFFWMSRSEMSELAEEHNFDDLYKDARTDEDRFIHTKLFGEDGIYPNLSGDAKAVLGTATDLVRKSFRTRAMVAEQHPEYHLQTWDAGYAQLKLVWKEFYPDEFKEFRQIYKDFEGRLRPLVYELGFLKS